METEYNSYRLGLTKRLVNWLRATVLGFSAIALDWERPFLGALDAWSSSIQGKHGPMKIQVVLRVLMSWLADHLEGGNRLQRPDTEVREPSLWTLRPRKGASSRCSRRAKKGPGSR